MRDVPGDRTLGKEKERVRGCRLVGSYVIVCMWCIWLLCVG